MSQSSVAPLFDVIIEPRWADSDLMGHINHAEYFRYLEEARVRWILDGGLANIAGNGEFGMIVANIGLDFRRQWHHPNKLRATAYVAALGNSSFRLRHYLHGLQSGELVAEGEVTLVWMALARQRSTPMGDSLRSLLARHQLPSG